MNERILTLLKQASKLANSEYNKDFDRKFDMIVADKFAELLLRECLSIVEPDEDCGDEWCVTLKETAQEIKEHFGVEE